MRILLESTPVLACSSRLPACPDDVAAIVPVRLVGKGHSLKAMKGIRDKIRKAGQSLKAAEGGETRTAQER